MYAVSYLLPKCEDSYTDQWNAFPDEELREVFHTRCGNFQRATGLIVKYGEECYGAA